ncbi:MULTISPECIES: type I phosphomannose isomerase catalytic subunit [unclassified Exiguobacterium]|uniref:type I phosphomannose isomerase catalytic subunit n=1 Tax=unclassified Exiguobacterium TaxID=2644629 RepID=UPI0020369D5D|nr:MULTISPECIES: type I phosphomannose isomerase catalytic subunit [unclassified Exiguobacterium]
MTILTCKPVFQERLWGGRKLETMFEYDIPKGNIGECWGISAHPNGMSVITSGEYVGRTLAELWKKERHLFGDYTLDSFPLLVKLLDAADDLSVQVHPNDEEAMLLEGESYGKTECWYVVEAEPGAELILGHTAETKEELAKAIAESEWDTLLRRQPVKTGDFIFVPSGTIHAIGEGIVILETQQSSDTTYRVYDFDRTDNAGNTRELHLAQAIEVTTVPDTPSIVHPTTTTEVTGGTIQTLIETDEFNVYRMDVTDGFTLKPLDRFRLISVLDGTGTLDGVPLEKGDHIVVTVSNQPRIVTGSMEFIVSDCNPK